MSLEVSDGLPYRSSLSDSGTSMFPDPFLDMASLVMPQSLKNTLDMCEGIWLKNGTYRMAAGRIVRYFITDIKYDGVGEDQRKKLSDFLGNKFNVVDNLALVGDDYLAYGNSFSSIVLPFNRFLVCTQCQMQQPISQIPQWEFKDFRFKAFCRRCRQTIPHTHLDRRSTEEDKIRVKRWAPQEMKLIYHPYSQDCEYYWDIPQHTRDEIKKGTKFYVQHMPWEVIEAIEKDCLFKFNPGVIYHMREDTLAGIDNRGWGVSRLLSNFAQAWYTQILKRYNEALAQDYVVPFRVLTPAAQRKEGDPLINMNLSSFVSKTLAMVRHHRKDPADWHALPFPIEYQALGGEAKSMTTPELIAGAMDEMLNGIGIPAELYKGTLQFQAMPTALRLFQQTWPHLVSRFNSWLNWMGEIVCTAMNWDQPENISLQPVTLADDIESRNVWLQLASANLVSKRTAFAPYGLDPTAEQEQIMAEQRESAELQQQMAEDMEQKQLNMQAVQGMPAGPGGAPMGPGMGMPAGPAAQQAMTPMDLQQQANALAQQLLQMPYEARRREMINIKQTNETLHALVKSQMESMRSEAAAVGQQAVLQGQV